MVVLELEKLIKREVKENSKSLFLDNHNIKVNNSGGKILLQKEEVGKFNFIYSKGKFIEYGAILGLKIDIYIEKSPIDRIIEKLELSFPKSIFCKHFYMSINSFDFQKEYFYKNGKVVFYPKDNFEEKIKEMINKIRELYFSKVNNYLNHLPILKDDILEHSKNYAYPLTSIIVNEYLNGNTNLKNIDDIIKVGKSRKLYDAKDKFIHEVKEKLIKFDSKLNTTTNNKSR